jgi:hypothetical protein
MTLEKIARSGRTGRRGILAKAAALGAAALAARAVRSDGARASNLDPLLAGAPNHASATTGLFANLDGRSLAVSNSSEGDHANALAAYVATPVSDVELSTAVFGKNGRNDGAGVWGEASGDQSVGVRAHATGKASVAVFATSDGSAAVLGEIGQHTQSGAVGVGGTGGQFGVLGLPGDQGGFGVFGSGEIGTGVGAQGLTGVVTVGGNLELPEAIVGVAVQALAPLVGVLSTVPAGKQDGPGVWGNAGQDITATEGAGTRAGVLGTSPRVGLAGVGGGADLAEVKALAAATGVAGIGLGPGSRGVYGTNNQGSGVGVLGESGGVRGVGVFGLADQAGVGVLAQGGGKGTALSVRGINRFTQAGRGEFAAGERRKVISGISATGLSGILVTLNSPAGAGVALQFARVSPAIGKATLQLNRAPKRAVRFTYFIIDSPTPGP